MIPAIHPQNAVQTLYLDFFEALSKSGFEGDISPEYAHRTALATDNSVYQLLPQGVLYPKTTNDLIQVAKLADESRFHTIKLSARGGGTGTNGQSLSDGVIVDISKHMNEILEINVDEQWARVQTGVVKDQLNAALKPLGLFFAPELSTSNRATIGGMINTDASGQGSRVYGKTRDHVLELETVLMDGSVVHSAALSDEELEAACERQDKVGSIHRVINGIYNEHKTQIEDTFPVLNRCLTGYDLAHIRDEENRFNLNNILCGSEGTLGFITEAKINLLKIPNKTAIVIVKYGDFESSLRDAQDIIKHDPTSVETIDSKVLNLAMNDFVWHKVEDFFSEPTPVPLQGINLVEYTADTEEALQDKMKSLISELNKKAIDARIGHAVAMGTEAVARVVELRKRSVGLLGNAKGEARPIPFVEDTAVPPEHLADYIMEFRALLDSHQLQYGMFGHVDVGVLHVRPALDMKDPRQEQLAWEISDKVVALTQKYKGLIWGEHGKGVRSEYAPDFFGDLYPEIQRVKAVFDERNQLNAGKIATPSDQQSLLKISEVTTRGELDRTITRQSWEQFNEAIYCNGNGACHNWNFQDAMCPSWKGTRLRTHTPKGRASLVREWLRLLNAKGVNTVDALRNDSVLKNALRLPQKLWNALPSTKNKNDFSHEVYDSMAACLACKSCTGQCPIKVDVPEFRAKFLALYHTRYLRPIKDHLVANLESLLPTLASLRPLYNATMRFAPTQALLKYVAGFIDGPALSPRNEVVDQCPLAIPETLNALDADTKTKTVAIVQDGFTSYFERELVADYIVFLRKLGFRPLLVPYHANGKPLHVHGFLKRFTKVASSNAQKLKVLAQMGIPLVGVDPSMTLTYRAEYRKYLTEEHNVNVLLIQEWLAQNHLQHLRDWTEQNTIAPISMSLLPHCTEKTNATSSVSQWHDVIDAMGGELKELSVGCCGMAGTYGHEARNEATSKVIYEQSWRPVIEAQDSSKALAATGYSCRCQVERMQNLAIQHPVQKLLASMQG